ncbi:S8 family serine peptidase [Prauserella cavernicola]|uniref:S8 family serine peptidase n=1 Tax=Prauserella cavernicola TaxID=2800127 RepID=A0A934QQB9_9PSEU|nr:S8 family serine peptidase [Prauserella cavernicola]MBK1783464.1 S8 family serine peptidase [Prauserella cavernicola]
MYVTRRAQALSCAALALTAVAAVPAPALAQQCLPEGGQIAQVPWAQDLLAPDLAWQAGTGAGQRVAVISTGVGDSPFLAGTVTGSVDLAPADSSTQRSGRADCLGTGTGAAGIVAGAELAGTGFRGVAPDARILSAKVVGDAYPSGAQPTGAVAPDRIADAVDWAVSQQASVIAVTTVSYHDSARLRASVDRAIAADAVVVAAVGDASQNDPPATVPYPAGHPGVLGVGAITRTTELAGFSRPGEVDLVAPGDDVVAPYPGGGLGTAAGTAYAAAYVAGSAALVRSYRSDLSAQDITNRLLATATPAGEGTGSAAFGHGIVNPHQAVLAGTAAGVPEAVPPMTTEAVTAQEIARQQDTERSSALAFGLAAAGIALAVLLAAVVVLGPRGRRRRWRSGRALEPTPASDPQAAPLGGLFGDRGK